MTKEVNRGFSFSSEFVSIDAFSSVPETFKNTKGNKNGYTEGAHTVDARNVPIRFVCILPISTKPVLSHE